MADYLFRTNRLSVTAIRKIFTTFGTCETEFVATRLTTSLYRCFIPLVRSCVESGAVDDRTSELRMRPRYVRVDLHDRFDDQRRCDCRIPRERLGHRAKLFRHHFRHDEHARFPRRIPEQLHGRHHNLQESNLRSMEQSLLGIGMHLLLRRPHVRHFWQRSVASVEQSRAEARGPTNQGERCRSSGRVPPAERQD